MIVNAHEIIQPYLENMYSKWIIRIPQDNSEEISIYSYPNEDFLLLEELVRLFIHGKIDEGQETPK